VRTCSSLPWVAGIELFFDQTAAVFAHAAELTMGADSRLQQVCPHRALQLATA
jgi:hypothetical protein